MGEIKEGLCELSQCRGGGSYRVPDGWSGVTDEEKKKEPGGEQGEGRNKTSSTVT